jgi:hypothetical protein
VAFPIIDSEEVFTILQLTRLTLEKILKIARAGFLRPYIR